MSRPPWLPALALLAASCGVGERAAEDLVTIGAVLPLSGPDAPTGEEIVTGLELAAGETLGGPRLLLKIADGQGTPAASARAYRELAADSTVQVIVGGWFASTGRTLAAVAATREASFVSLSPLLVAPAADGNSFALHHVEALAQAAARFARDELGARRAGVLRVSSSGISRQLADAFAGAFAPEGRGIAWTIAPDDSGALALPPGPERAVDVLWIAGPGSWAVRCSELSAKTRRAAVMTAEGWSTEGLASLAERGTPVYVAAFFSSHDPSPASRRLLEACARTGREPTLAIALGWDAAQLVRHAFAGTGARGGPFRAMIRGVPPLEGATGRIEALASGGRRETPAILSLSPEGSGFVCRVEAASESGG